VSRTPEQKRQQAAAQRARYAAGGIAEVIDLPLDFPKEA